MPPKADDVVIELTEAEFHAAARRALATTGLTYAQLAEQARGHRLDNAQAASVWSVIGGELPDDFT